MRKLLVFQHVPHEPLGLLDPLLRGHGFRIRYVNFGRLSHAEPDIERYDGLVVLGGPMNVDEADRHPHLLTETRVIRRAVERDIPVLGICLGAQLLASALGAEVRPSPVHEIGWYPVATTEAARGDPLFRHFGHQHAVFQWHAYTFDVPAGAALLASSGACPNQAFRFGERAYGLQFHLEADQQLISRWISRPDYRVQLESAHGHAHLGRVHDDTRLHVDAATVLGQRVFSEFVALFRRRRRYTLLRTR